MFPGGNLETKQDSDIPGPEDPRRHRDGDAYRLGAIRECFEESGLLLARGKNASGTLLDVSEERREQGRHAIHENKVLFQDWVDQCGGIPDTGMPFISIS